MAGKNLIYTFFTEVWYVIEDQNTHKRGTSLWEEGENQRDEPTY